jgi:hypothetical protein
VLLNFSAILVPKALKSAIVGIVCFAGTAITT